MGEITEPGLYPDIPIDAYVADPVAHGSLSSSELGTILTCPAKHGYNKTSPALSFGSAAHHLVLEGWGGFHDRYHVMQHDGRTRDGKAERQHADDHGLTVLRQSDYDAIQAMAQAIRAHETAHSLLTSGPPEQTVVWQDEATGVWLRSRPDVLPAGAVTVDYKTVADASPEAIRKAAFQYGWARQAALMCDGLEAVRGERPEQCALVCQEKEPPYVVTVVTLSDAAVETGRMLNRWGIERYLRCRESGVWPGYTEYVAEIDLPAWADHAVERIKDAVQPETQAPDQAPEVNAEEATTP